MGRPSAADNGRGVSREKTLETARRIYEIPVWNMDPEKGASSLTRIKDETRHERKVRYHLFGSVATEAGLS